MIDNDIQALEMEIKYLSSDIVDKQRQLQQLHYKLSKLKDNLQVDGHIDNRTLLEG